MESSKKDRRKKYYTVKEVAEILGISKPNVYKLCHENEIPNDKIRGKIKIPIKRFNNFLKYNTKYQKD